MGAFTSKKIIYGNHNKIPYIAEEIRKSFIAKGFEVRIVEASLGNEIYITKAACLKLHLD